jgi:hypothetical protein
MRSKAHRAPTASLVLHRARIDKCAVKKFAINGGINFFIVMLRFSLGKSTMIAPRPYKLRGAKAFLPALAGVQRMFHADFLIVNEI